MDFYFSVLGKTGRTIDNFEEWWYAYGDYVWCIAFVIFMIVHFVLAIAVPIIREAEPKPRPPKVVPHVTIQLLGYQTISISTQTEFYPDVPEKVGYSFQGWFYDPSFTKPFIPGKRIKKDITLYPKWVKE